MFSCPKIAAGGKAAQLSQIVRNQRLIGFTVAAEDVRHFQLRAIQGARRLEVLLRSRLDLHRNRTRQQIQWARC
jgi:hypothetical protein